MLDAPEGEKDTTMYNVGLSGQFIKQLNTQNGSLAVRLGLPPVRCLFPERPRLLDHLSYIGEEGGTGSDVPGRGRTLPTEYDGRHLGEKQIRIDLCSDSLVDQGKYLN